MPKLLTIAFSARFVDASNVIREEFVDFVPCNTGRALADEILETLQDYGLEIKHLRGQAYDGAGNMAGRCNGAATLIQSSCPKAVYVHCAVHTVWYIAACIHVQLIKNMMGMMVEI